MGAKNGKEFISRINQLKTEIWVDGHQLKGPISECPEFKGLLKSKATLYDYQISDEHKSEMTYDSPTSGKRVGISFLQPTTKEDLKKRRTMIENWAFQTCGLMGRSPDYLNTALMSFASSASFLEGKENCFPENIQSAYERAREQDLTFTHTFITPQVNRASMYFESSDEPISAKIVKTTEEGLIIKGAKLLATQGGLTDEILVFSAPRLLPDPDEAFAFTLPSDTDGIRFICRESFTNGDSTFDYPLSSRFEEMDSIVVFDNVLIPWDRVFFYQNPEAASRFFSMSSFHPYTLHQVITRQVVKTEFILSVAMLLIETINVGEYSHVQGKVSEIIISLETMKALLDKSEQDATLDQWGYLRPSIVPLQVASNIFPIVYPRFSEIIQLIGASGLVTIPTEKAFQSEIHHDLVQYLQGATKSAEDRVKIFRLAWDLTMSSFGTRQTQYERYFFGDPIRLSSQLYRSYSSTSRFSMIESLLGPLDCSLE
ncbi:4-hydroxyphenylacetate 3-monooxygenase, oxygenase component [Sporosarcina sp. BI001-red]|uniref:4-hydroxyphenylacetate 3-monooxygenase, oxygenase component n=1 Tax=Sporosarcina sp. BI001-red TaxID=2282866 RepID=UPI000E247327|nr:4-hydroxyphenylacetate 3-monooxygenase, oxygenase component [Sporosarcina sp. BI001-red]REB07888.1 4-hydroxyphenylacetate 3-monooxygenase, oxygenase component [Sporosarcina sp. BI001-red]